MQWIRLGARCCPGGVTALSVVVDGAIYSFDVLTSINSRALPRVHVCSNPDYPQRWKTLTQPERSEDDASDDGGWPTRWYSNVVAASGEDVFVVGGAGVDGEQPSTLHRFHTTSSAWSAPKVSGEVPPALLGRAACAIGSSLYLLGGLVPYLSLGFPVHRLDLQTMTWTLLQCRGRPPTPRNHHSATAVGDRVYVFAGQRVGRRHFRRARDDLHWLDTATLTWHSVEPGEEWTPIPPPRGMHAAANLMGKLLVFGGMDALKAIKLNDLWLFDPESGVWREQLMPLGVGPFGRHQPAMCTAGGRTFIMGGMLHLNEEDMAYYCTDGFELALVPSLKAFCQRVIIREGVAADALPPSLLSEVLVLLKYHLVLQ